MAAASTAVSSSQTLIGASGAVYIGTPGATITAPTSEASAVDTDLLTVGFISEDGIKFRDSKDTSQLKAWQTPYDVRKFVTGRSFELEFSMEQWNWHTVPIAFGGGTLTIPTAGHYKYVPPDANDLDPRSVIVDWQDGTRLYRLWLPNCIVTAPVEVTVKRDEASVFPVTLSALFDGTNNPFEIYTDDAAFQNV